ncbi:MAG TPA: FAD-dependent monooxygenase [Polyangiaceae bacterium]|jgi:2-polyprenyl-6-methoxyphenol hydroxylase-like FAD-dependent oxidoreductase
MNVLISGCGVAGPALAFWLSKIGARVTVVERAPSFRDGGYAVDVRGAALDVLARMGLREAVRPFETDTLRNAVVDSRGRRFGEMPRGFGVVDEGDVEIHRGDLSRVLYDATRAAVDYRFGDSIAALDQAGARVAVTLASGASDDFDLVVGADGVHSRTRALTFPDDARFVHPLGSVMAIFTVPNMLGLDREQLMFSAPHRVASVKSANGNRELKVCVFVSTDGAVDSSTPLEDVEAQRELVARAFRDAGWEFPRIVSAMERASDFYFDVTCQIRMDRHYEGRVVLVGDAGYCPSPLSGQGTSLALVGAYVLAASLAATPGDVPAALARYDATMKGFARENQDVALRIAEGFAPATPFEAWSRNAAMRILPYVPGSGVLMKLAMGKVRKASRAITLPAAVG